MPVEAGFVPGGDGATVSSVAPPAGTDVEGSAAAAARRFRGPPPQHGRRDAELRGVGASTAKSAALSSVSVQPFPGGTPGMRS